MTAMIAETTAWQQVLHARIPGQNHFSELFLFLRVCPLLFLLLRESERLAQAWGAPRVGDPPPPICHPEPASAASRLAPGLAPAEPSRRVCELRLGKRIYAKRFQRIHLNRSCKH